MKPGGSRKTRSIALAAIALLAALVTVLLPLGMLATDPRTSIAFVGDPSEWRVGASEEDEPVSYSSGPDGLLTIRMWQVGPLQVLRVVKERPLSPGR
jgi:hypothetical protein